MIGATVSRAGYSVLRTLAEDPGAMVRQVQSLEVEALVERTTAAHDRRLKHVALSGRGEVVLGRLWSMRVAYMDRVLDGWSPSERSRFAASVDRLTDALISTPYPAGPAGPTDPPGDGR